VILPENTNIFSGPVSREEVRRKEEGIREGKLAVELYPVSEDAEEGPNFVLDLTQIYVMVGEYEEAVDQIEYLLSISSHLSVPLLRLDPRLDPLREHPRFKQLLEKHSESVEQSVEGHKPRG
jgi:hypothetical protein